MKRPNRAVPFVWCVALMSISFFCSHVPLAGGDVTETGNARVLGKIVDSLGSAVRGARVQLLPANYDPEKMTGVVAADTTDTAGEYVFAKVNSGIYSIQALNRGKSGGAIIRGIHVTNRFDTLASDTLRPPGTVKIALPANADLETGYTYIPGTTFFSYLKNSSGFATLDSVPGEIAADIAYSTTNSTSFSVLRFGVQVTSFDTAVVWNPEWRYAREFTLNTSSSGAGVSGAVTNFPVLIRLTAENFDFTQVVNNGEDIRFTKADNSFLPYQIERWDPVTGLAEVWVRVDTLWGNNENQHIQMYWGASTSSAASISNGQAVFDTAAGFQGVWHLGESSATLYDATINGFNGSRNGNQKRIPGEIGFGQGYDGSGDYSDMGDVCNPGASAFTVCAWIKLATTKQYQAIISKSRGDSPSLSYGWLVEIGSDGALTLFAATDTGTWGGARTFVLASRIFITDTVSWHHIAVVIDRSGNSFCKLYIDGSMITSFSVVGDIADIGDIVNSVPLRLGSDAKGGCPLNGSLDECSIAFAARSPDWVKLCYMNQKKDDKLVFSGINATK